MPSLFHFSWNLSLISTAFIFQFIFLFNYVLIHLSTHHPFIHSSIIHSFIHPSSIHSFTHHPFIHSLIIHSFIHYPFIHSPIIHSFIHYPFIHSSIIHSFTQHPSIYPSIQLYVWIYDPVPLKTFIIGLLLGLCFFMYPFIIFKYFYYLYFILL